MSVVIIYICHDTNSVKSVIQKNHKIIFVGNNELENEYINHPNIIIARNLKYNIEHEPKLLTFTAWYAIIYNQLFMEYEYLCLFEYDVEMDNNFESNLMYTCNQNKYNNIGFGKACPSYLFASINIECIANFLKNKQIDPYILYRMPDWSCTTNQCMSRSVLKSFVDWYYPDCLEIKQADLNGFSWYHERLYSIYLNIMQHQYMYMDGLTHYSKNSHVENHINEYRM
jgi:hypothetical protein